MGWGIECAANVNWLGQRVCSYRGLAATESVQLSRIGWGVECAANVGRRVCSYRGLART